MSRVMKYDTIAIELQKSEVAKNLGAWAACTERTAQRKNFELILTVKMETIHPVEGQFGREFPVICNHCGVMTACSRKT